MSQIPGLLQHIQLTVNTSSDFTYTYYLEKQVWTLEKEWQETDLYHQEQMKDDTELIPTTLILHSQNIKCLTKSTINMPVRFGSIRHNKRSVT